MCFSDIIYSIYGILYMYITIDIIDTLRVYNIYDITKYGCVFLKLGESIYVAMDLIPIHTLWVRSRSPIMLSIH